ncbi:ABC transporter substrate-binding protein [Candidatus Bealeia paramacronuclearis]|uniref:ABC transporter substrate-binding protein n=1 Tax=Candidatus Bealeia paramacronuclearis TaxID=1921001 RepID=A0ABZ2C728_9PROT|nr:ABC transporter substrate-binding protein [Candidatus Bealeia paramacronuclearis]
MKFRFLLTVLMLVTTPFLAKAEQTHATPEAFIQEIGDQVITLLTNKMIDTPQRAKVFRDIFETKFNVKSIGKFVLGRYWKQATPEQKEKFLQLFTDGIVNSYATRFQEYTSQKFEVTGSRKESDGGITVISEITPEQGQPIRVDWKLFEKNGELRIYDVLLDGISMSITQRSEYSAVIQQGGGKIDSLLKALEDKLVILE